MAKDDRFEKVYSQGAMNVTEIWVDKETGDYSGFESLSMR